MFVLVDRMINNTRIDESKRLKRMSDERYSNTSMDRKRRVDRSDRRIEAPPPPRFDTSADLRLVQLNFFINFVCPVCPRRQFDAYLNV